MRVIIPDDVDRYLESVIKAGMFGNKAELARAAIVHFLNTIGPISKGYDTETFFSPDGRIFQLEYAKESVNRGVPVIGIVCDDGVLLASENPSAGAETLAVSNPCIQHVSDKLIIGYSGLASDAMVVIDKLKSMELKKEAQVIAAIREIYWGHTMQRDARPLGAGLLLATKFGRPKLFEVEPGGMITEYVASVIGNGGESAKAQLAKAYKRSTISSAGKLVPKILGDGEYSVETLMID